MRISATDWTEDGWPRMIPWSWLAGCATWRWIWSNCFVRRERHRCKDSDRPGYQVPFSGTNRREAWNFYGAVGMIYGAQQADEIHSGRAGGPGC